MAVVYFYIPAKMLGDIINCGLKLSEWKGREQATPWSSVDRPCFSALLHPHDDPRYKDNAFQCVKLNLLVEYCVVADNDLYRLSIEHPEIKNEYISTMVPLDRYIFGSYRMPECLVFTTVLPDQISCLGRGMDEPILYENSETLYVNNLLQRYNDRYADVNQVLLYSFLTLKEQYGVMKVYRSNNSSLAVFFDDKTKRHITVPIPDFEKYRIY